MSSPPQFEIKILRQGWLGEPADWIRDTTSGGALRVTIGGVVVTDHDEYGIVQSALALLRTLERNHSPESRATGFGYLLCHYCGFPLFGCSNFGTDWAVLHDDGHVVLSAVEYYDSYPIVRHLTFPDANVRLPLAEYRREIVGFAKAARAFYFAEGAKVIDEEWEREVYEEFWQEYDTLLRKHGGLSSSLT